MSGYGRETASKTAGRLTLEMQPKTRTYSDRVDIPGS